MANQEQEQKLAEFIDLVGEGNKPWYLKTSAIYEAVKNAAADIPNGGQLVDQTIASLSALTKYINESARLNVVIEPDQSYTLIEKVDKVLSDQLMVFDDGFDSARARLASSLRQLLTALARNREWALSSATETKTTVAEAVKTRYEQAWGFITSLVEHIKANYPGAYENIVVLANTSVGKAQEIHNAAASFVDETKVKLQTAVTTTVTEVRTGVHAKLFGTIDYILKTAQPFVHGAVIRGKPYLTHAVEVGQPYLEKAKPYVEPVIVKATEVKGQLEESKVFGPYIATAYAYAQVALDETKNYAIPTEVSQ